MSVVCTNIEVAISERKKEENSFILEIKFFLLGNKTSIINEA